MRCHTVGRIVTIALSLLCAPLAVEAQPPSKVARVGLLSAGSPRSARQWVALDQRLRELGYVEGHTLETAFRNPEGRVERFSAFAVELIHFQPDVIVAAGPETSLRAVKQATSTIPIVMIAIDYDPMALGYVAGLARPGGNITGVSFQQIELTGKRLELLKDALPGITRVAVFWDTFTTDQLGEAVAAARVLGVQLQELKVWSSFIHLPHRQASYYMSLLFKRLLDPLKNLFLSAILLRVTEKHPAFG